MSALENAIGVEGAESTTKALPASWYTSEEMYDLERRSIFSKKWLLTTHKSRLPGTGDWVRYDTAGFDFILVRDREGKINGFHNVCRHRAFPIVTEEKGHNSIFACKYHGWSYGLNGKLAKAPGYQELADFDKSKNGLFPVHVHVDNAGFVWANMDNAEKPEIAWSEDLKGIDTQYTFEDYKFDHTWEMEGECNWKVLAEHFSNSTPEKTEKNLSYFPNASVSISSHLFVVQRFTPTSASKSVMRYEVYRNQNSSDEDFETINATYKRVVSEGKAICSETQKNLTVGASASAKTGPADFQKTVRDIVQAHYKKEQEAGTEIWPARQVLPKNASATSEDVAFCSNVDCCRNK
ncbi:Rieske [2Fe-2S] iron-sulfur domain-containing protein [Mariannaea sp. PMI_226]|nr:Rieske [2Fe-2S] iron-sulfur domain-containing protein [Mariannaea sp. PMI_226]